MKMASGSCLCGAVRYEIDDAAVVLSVGCGCDNCAKVSGSRFAVYLQVRPRGFRWLQGFDRLGGYESSPGNKRAFCRTCGSVVPIQTAYGAVRVPAGALDQDPGHSPDVLLFAGRDRPWCNVGTATRHFEDAGPKEFWQETAMRLYGLS
jgi:hypothetical protein